MVRSPRKPAAKRAKSSKQARSGRTGRPTSRRPRRGTSLADLPDAVRDYLSSGDSLYRATLQQQYPNLQRVLTRADARSAVATWLAGEEALRDELAEVAANALEFIRPAARAADASIARRFVLHPHALVRLRADELLLTLYFRNRNREATLLLLQSMLLDPADLVRAQAVRHAERVGVDSTLRTLLQGWLNLARAQGFAATESAELAERLLEGPPAP